MTAPRVSLLEQLYYFFKKKFPEVLTDIQNQIEFSIWMRRVTQS
jgi:hypothetical protein